MAADVVLESEFSNACCADLKKKYLKVKSERNFLKQGLKAIEVKTDKLVQENLQLKKAYKEEQFHGKQEKEEKIKESSIRQKLEKEIHNLKAEISSYQKDGCLINVNDDKNQLIKAQDEIKRLKELIQKEKKKYDSEMKNADSEKKKAAEAWKLVKVEKNKAEEERKLAEIERKKAEDYRLCLEKLKAEVKDVREELNAEISKADDAKRRVEAERQKTSIEKTRADSLTMKAVEQKRIMEVERKRAIDEKVCADRLSQMLEKEKQMREELQKKIEETLSSSKGRCDSCNREERHGGNVSVISANMKLLRRQLKLEKKQAKYSKRMAKLEKAEKNYIMQEIHILKHSFMQILSRFNMLDDRLSHSIEGTDAAAKIGKPSEIHHGFKLKKKMLGSKRGNHHSRIGCGLTKTCCMSSFNITEPTRECICLPLPGCSCTRSTAGITSELESPIGGSDRNKSQSSAICSNTSYSDKGSMGSQERGSIAVTASGKFTKKHPSKRPTVMKLCSEVAKTGKNVELGVMANSVNKICDRREVVNACLIAPKHDQMEEVDREFDRNSKRRKIQDAMGHVARVYTENNPSHFEIGGKLSAFKDILNIGGVTALNCSQICGTSQNFHNGASCFSKGHSQSRRLNCNQIRSPVASKQKTPVLQALSQNGRCGKFDSQRSRGPSFIAETTPFSDKLRGNICIEQEEGIALSNEQSDLIRFEGMIRDNCLKLLDLENDADEERYRMASEMPLSPTLPKFEDPELPNHQQYVDNDTQCVTERDNLVPLHAVDVMLTEISHEGRYSLYPAKDPGKTSVIELQNCVSQHGRPDSVEDNPSLSKNHSSLDVEQRHPPGKSANNMIDTVMVPFLGGHNVFPNSNICRDSTSDVIDDPFLSGAMAGSYILQDDGFWLSSTGMVDNFRSNASSVVNRQNEARGHADNTPSGLIESQKDEVDVPDSMIVPIKDQMFSAEIKEFANGNNDIFNAEIAKRDNIHQLSASNQSALSTGCSFRDSSSANPCAKIGETPVCCVVFSNIKDRDSISRILHVRNTFSHQSFMVSQIDHAVVQAHNALAKNTVLLPEEKGSVFFSLLLCNISSRMSANFKCTMGEYLLPCFKSFAAEINKVLSDAETRSLFEEICPLSILAGLIEDFLIERKILMCIDRLYECEDKSSDSFQLDGAYVFSRTATMDQFVAGCIILASIFAAAGICFLLEASYRILRMRRKNLSWILLALHIFASVCGKEYFNANEYSFLIIALRSVVLSLERGHQSVSSVSPCLHEELETEPSFPPCSECPFAAGAVCMDKLVDILLDVVQCYVLTGVGYKDINNSVNFSVCMVPACTVRDEESRELHGQTNTSHASCSLFTFRKHAADLPDCFPDRAFCHFNDIVALVELVGGYMSWEWTYSKIIPHLSKILESCKNEEFSVALFVLIGQLGRFGIDVGGHQKRGIAELRSNMSLFVDQTIAREMSLPTQFAAIGALLNLLPLRFRDIVGEYELTLDTSQSGHVKLMKKWFSKLSKQQQSLALNLFGQDN